MVIANVWMLRLKCTCCLIVVNEKKKNGADVCRSVSAVLAAGLPIREEWNQIFVHNFLEFVSQEVAHKIQWNFRAK